MRGVRAVSARFTVPSTGRFAVSTVTLPTPNRSSQRQRVRSQSSQATASLLQPSSGQKRYRPLQANGKTIPFHISDLINQQDLYSQAAQPVYQDLCDDTTAKAYESDLIVVLDMDECLIHSQFLSSPQTAQVYAHQLKQQRRQSTRNAGKAVVDHFKITLPEGDLVHVNLRPGLTEFLEKVGDRFETHIFTAASKVYAKPVLDRLDPDGTLFAGRWYREHCSYQDFPTRAYVKNLENLPLANLSRVVLVDNNPLSFLSHPTNGILVSSFYNDPNDTSLRTVWKLLEELDAHEDDVRPILEERFGLPQALDRMAAEQRANDF
jgi:Dullard-like phosphatase family protein